MTFGFMLVVATAIVRVRRWTLSFGLGSLVVREFPIFLSNGSKFLN